MAEKLSSNILKQLQSWFGIGFKSGGKKSPPEMFPIKTQDVEENGKILKSIEKLPFDEDTKKLFDYWLSNTRYTEETWKNRREVFDDMNIAYYNSPIISRSMEITADEIIQADTNDQIIFVEGKAKIKKFIYEFFDKIKLNSHLRPTALDIVQYGNAGWLLGVDVKDGITEIIPVEVNSIKDRLEFNPVEVEKQLKINNTFKKYSQFDRINQLITSITEKDMNNTFFKKYLFGFQIEDTIVPPWKFLHFRNLTNKSPFAPFGIPPFIHSMSSYRQYDASMGLQQTARALRFPKSVYTLNVPNTVGVTEKINKAIEFLNAIQNSGLGTSKKELSGLGEVIVTIKDLYEYEHQVAEIDLGKVDDLQMLKDDIIMSTFLPRNLIDPNDSAFGDSGVSLIEKFKPFARTVYRFQTIMLEQITQLVKLQCIYSGQFQPDEIDFVLSMKYPESQTNSDIISSQSSLLGLANDIIDTIKDKITDGSPLPPELIKNIYTQFLPYDTNKIEAWINDALKAKEKEEEEKSQDEFGIEDETEIETDTDFNSDTNDSEPVELPDDKEIEDKLDSFDSFGENKKKVKSKYHKYYLVEKTIGKKQLKEAINDIIFEEKQKTVRDLSYGGRHFYSSKNNNNDFDSEKLFEFDKKRIKMLKENQMSKRNKKKYLDEVRNYSEIKEELEEVELEKETDFFDVE